MAPVLGFFGRFYDTVSLKMMQVPLVYNCPCDYDYVPDPVSEIS